MYKKYIASLLLVLLASNSYALDFYPAEIGGAKDLLNAMSLTNTKVVTIYIKNTDDKDGAKYKLLVDGKQVGTTGNIAWEQREAFKVPIRLDELGVPETHKVCAATIVTTGISVMQCTYAYVLWVKNE